MAKLPEGKAVVTRRPRVSVEAGLAPGRHRFRLEVRTADGRVSEPDTVVVVVSKEGRTPGTTPRPGARRRGKPPGRPEVDPPGRRRPGAPRLRPPGRDPP